MKRLLALSVALLSCCLLSPLQARERPRWEVGLAHATAQLPHYTGSNHYYQRSLTLPYGILRGEQIEVAGTPRLFTDFGSELRLELAFGAEVPVESDPIDKTPPRGAEGSRDKVLRDKNYTRRGMANIQALLGVGVKLDWYLGEHVTVDLPLLNATTLGGGFAYVGNTFSPGFRIDAFARDSDYTLAYDVSWVYGDRNFNRTFYSVTPEDVLTERPEYTATAGLISRNEGLLAAAIVNRRLSIFAYGYQYWLTNSVVRDSPLVVVERNEGWAFGLVYAFFASDDSVQRRK
jgi:outer membrane scaffolding protein for murein synthesis (MipA/OmpV family)